MQSATKTDFSTDLVEALTRDHFGTSIQITRTTPLTDGWFNTAYEIQFANHAPDAVLRIAPPPELRLLTYENGMMAKEKMVHQVLQTMASVPVPRILGWHFERRLIDRDYMFVEKLRGTPLNKIESDLTPDEKAAIHTQLGEIVREIYRYKGKAWGYFGDGLGNDASTWRDAFSAFISAILDDGEDLGVALPMSYTEIRTLFSTHAHVLDEIQVPVLVHWDLWPGNIFITRQGGKPVIEGIIDWERACWADPESEPAIASSFYGPAFFQGYGRDLSKGADAEIRHAMYGLYLLLVMMIEARVRFETAEHLGWVREQLTLQLQRLHDFPGKSGL